MSDASDGTSAPASWNNLRSPPAQNTLPSAVTDDRLDGVVELDRNHHGTKVGGERRIDGIGALGPGESHVRDPVAHLVGHRREVHAAKP